MILSALFGLVCIVAGFAYLTWRKVNDFDIAFLETGQRPHSRPVYHVVFTAVCSAFSGLIALFLAIVISHNFVDQQVNLALDRFVESQGGDIQSITQIKRDLILRDSKALSAGEMSSKIDALREHLSLEFSHLHSLSLYLGTIFVWLVTAIAGFLAYRKISVEFRARIKTEKFIQLGLGFSAIIAILTTIGIVLSLIGETFYFFSGVSVGDFIFGTTWSPLSGVYEGRIESDKVGALPLFAGTLMITVIAMSVAIPCGLFSAIYLSDFASNRVRAYAKPALEILAGIPTVVYGFFAAITIAPIIRDFGEAIGLNVDAQSALAAGSVMGIMIIPFISSLSDDVINAVPQSLRDGALALGATKGEMIWKIVLPAALPGIVSATILGVSRAAGETMIVVMAAGQSANLTWNPFEAVTTVTVQIVALITGDVEAATAAGPAFALGFVLFCFTLIFNIIALMIVRKYRERYE